MTVLTFSNLGYSGRLGNQLWQIASTIGLAESHGFEFGFPEWPYAPYFEVGAFCGPVPEAAVEAGSLLPKEGRPFSRLEKHSEWRKSYLQDYSLFRHHEMLVRELLSPTAPAEDMVASHEDYLALPHPVLALHVRRGDNATSHLRNEQGYHPLRPNSYYQEAVKRYPEAASIAVFSDDLPWCRTHVPEIVGRNDVYYFEGGPARPRECEPNYHTADVQDWVDLLAMTHCDYFVCSNSTYSWWGAFLSGTAGENITYPTPFYGPKLRYIDASIMFPHTWRPLQHDV